MLRRSGNELGSWASLASVQVVDVYLAASLIACLHMFYTLMENNFLEDLRGQPIYTQPATTLSSLSYVSSDLNMKDWPSFYVAIVGPDEKCGHFMPLKPAWNWDLTAEFRSSVCYEYIAFKIVDQNLCGSSQYTCLFMKSVLLSIRGMSVD